MIRFGYKLLQRMMVLEGVSVMVAQTESTPGTPGSQAGQGYPNDRRKNCRAGLISPSTLREAIALGHAPYCEALVERMDEDRLWCFGVVCDDRLQSFAWFHLGAAEPDMNYGRYLATATAMQLTPDAAFVFHAYTAPQARGRRLMGDSLAAGAAWLAAERGVRRLVATTELVNHAARRAFAHAGYHHQAAYWRYGFGGRAAGWYPRPEAPVVAYG